MNNIKQLRTITNLNQKEFANKYLIPLKTLQNWETNIECKSYRKCPNYVYKLLKNKVINDYKKEYIETNITNIPCTIEDKFLNSIKHGLDTIISSSLLMYVDDVILYGSLARKDNKKDSDVDLLLVLDKAIKNVKGYQKNITKLKGSISTNNINDPENDLHVVYGDEYKQSNDAYYKNIVKDGISIWN